MKSKVFGRHFPAPLIEVEHGLRAGLREDGIPAARLDRRVTECDATFTAKRQQDVIEYRAKRRAMDALRVKVRDAFRRTPVIDEVAEHEDPAAARDEVCQRGPTF